MDVGLWILEFGGGLEEGRFKGEGGIGLEEDLRERVGIGFDGGWIY